MQEVSHLAGTFPADGNLGLLMALLGQGWEGRAGTDHGGVLMREKLLKHVPELARDEESGKTSSAKASPRAADAESRLISCCAHATARLPLL